MRFGHALSGRPFLIRLRSAVPKQTMMNSYSGPVHLKHAYPKQVNSVSGSITADCLWYQNLNTAYSVKKTMVVSEQARALSFPMMNTYTVSADAEYRWRATVTAWRAAIPFISSHITTESLLTLLRKQK